MDLEQLQLLAGRIRDLLQDSNHPIGRNHSLDLIAALPGLRCWPEVRAFPDRVAACKLDESSAERLAARLKKKFKLSLSPLDLLHELSDEAADQRAKAREEAARKPVPDAALLEHLRKLKSRLDVAILNGRSPKWCLTRWSQFIKARDGNRCVMCGRTEGLEAHHIWRKTTYSEGRFELGNGITLCKEHHADPHSEFNGHPDMQQPLGAEGGDDQDQMAVFYAALLRDAEQRGLDQNEFYFIKDKMLQFFVGVQGYEHLYWSVQRGEISRLRMAARIWRDMPEVVYQKFFGSLLGSNSA
jgi:hypothetical protein